MQGVCPFLELIASVCVCRDLQGCLGLEFGSWVACFLTLSTTQQIERSVWYLRWQVSMSCRRW